MQSFSQKAPAKINLFLKVTAKRKDGYHELDMLLLPLTDLHDTICVEFTAKPGIVVDCASSAVPCNEKNLCWQAAAKYCEAAQISPACHITIHKKIPIAAGLGGGSSDTATVLKIFNQKYNALSEAELQDIALQCGADVPFFLQEKAAFARGVGEKLTYLPDFHFPHPLLLINPLFPVSAAWAYKNLSPENIAPLGGGFHDAALDEFMNPTPQNLQQFIHNDLAKALYNKFPLLRMLQCDLLKFGALAAEISGSGPTLFAICKNQKQRDKLIKQLLASHPPLTMFKVDN